MNQLADTSVLRDLKNSIYQNHLIEFLAELISLFVIYTSIRTMLTVGTVLHEVLKVQWYLLALFPATIFGI